MVDRVGGGRDPLPPLSEAKALGKGETHLRDPPEARLLPGRDMAMRLRVRVRGGMGGVPGAEERGRVGCFGLKFKATAIYSQHSNISSSFPADLAVCHLRIWSNIYQSSFSFSASVYR